MGSTVQFGLVCFLVFFGLAQFFQWAQHFPLPLPIFILGGAFLAIASNADRRAGLPFSVLNSLDSHTPASESPSESSVSESATESEIESEEPAVKPTPDPIKSASAPSISFTIRRS